ncbi:lytic murein transglycosylase [Methylobrevis albus]|uniref:lytic murein transglycosylase n=1 Tax=Methylobrevis albus TaxID=2793297 RepID=UPI002E2D6931|nr:lytic murein transglycosylase [Methylobrevis albus]
MPNFRSSARSLRRPLATLTALAALVVAAPAAAQQCGNDASGFSAWTAAFKQQAIASGISPQVAATLDSVTYNTQVIKLDRGQRATFKTDFASFAAKRVTGGRISKGKQMLTKHARLFDAVEAQYGVPREILTAIWGMETDYGAVTGKLSVVRSLATLAYDCRRSPFFSNELLAALTIIQRGDKSPKDMVGAWAGEVGQTQFLASNYLKYAVDFDGDGRRDLIRSTPDVLASTANFLRAHGWIPGAGYQPGEPNFQALVGWNKSENYQRAIALFASKLN